MKKSIFRSVSSIFARMAKGIWATVMLAEDQPVLFSDRIIRTIAPWLLGLCHMVLAVCYRHYFKLSDQEYQHLLACRDWNELLKWQDAIELGFTNFDDYHEAQEWALEVHARQQRRRYEESVF